MLLHTYFLWSSVVNNKINTEEDAFTEEEIYNSTMKKLSTRRNKSLFSEEQLKSIENNENFVVGNNKLSSK